MLLDFQMPQKNGIQVLTEVRELYSEKRKTYGLTQLIEPEFIFLTAYMTNGFKNHLSKIGIDKGYEKPLLEQQLRNILKII